MGISRRAAAIAAAGMVLSQPTSSTIASRQCPVTASSIESAMVSRDTSDARMPSLPIAMPSVTAMVLNSIGVPPAAVTRNTGRRNCRCSMIPAGLSGKCSRTNSHSLLSETRPLPWVSTRTLTGSETPIA